ncbi:hypothetical protein Q0590_29570 [Rhodocytophaga aerolata]|uniref:Uncharacterized protein n=1 Tax=Rhodocytophaga aerolata TaxID=455078 RepID=A0ABT8RFI6_9BACT|nr:hypothetical protein [Rhodocytophaga aerolata]MDO1450461.1 hypothetical protein [Rhodocytophaga aerolata]
MKKSNQKIDSNSNQETTEEINWIVIGPILAVILGAIVWTVLF